MKNKKFDNASEIKPVFFQSKKDIKKKTKLEIEERMLKSLRNINMIKSYRRKKALRGAKEMMLVNNSLIPFTSLLFLECFRKRSRETK